MSEPDPFDIVRAWFASYNSGEIEALAGFYEEAALLEHEEGSVAGLEGIRAEWGARFRSWAPGLESGHRRRVRMIGLIESGVIHAEWIERETDPASGQPRERAGYSDFTLTGGRIRTQREVVGGSAIEPPVAAPAPPGPVPSRRYPARPVVGVGAVIVQDGRVVLIRRKYEPLAGQWSLPGGTLDLGETLEAGVAREMLEETGLHVAVGPVIEVFDRILLDLDGRVQYHFVLIDYLCRPMGGTLQAGSDVDDAVLADPADLGQYRLTAKAKAVIARGVELAHGWH